MEDLKRYYDPTGAPLFALGVATAAISAVRGDVGFFILGAVGAVVVAVLAYRHEQRWRADP